VAVQLTSPVAVPSRDLSKLLLLPVSAACAVQLYEESLQDSSGHYPGPATDVFWQFSTPAGLQSVLAWVSKRYHRPELWVAENGVALPGEANLTREAAVRDEGRVQFFR